jgi:hypothetical protein
MIGMDAVIPSSADFYLQYSADVQGTTTKVSTPVSVWFNNGDIYVPTSTGWAKITNYPLTRAIYNVSLDTSTKIYRVYINGDIVYEGLMPINENAFINTYTGVVNVLFSGGSEVKVYSIKAYGFGGISTRIISSDIRDTLESNGGNVAYLAGCNETAKFKAGDVSSYRSVYDFCNSQGGCVGGQYESGDIEYSDVYEELKYMIRFNPKCYKEVMNYCVDVVYPADMGMADSSLKSPSDGMLACSTILSVDIGANKILAPVTNSLWAIIRQNPMQVILAVVIIVLIFAIAGSRRK